MRVSLLNVYSNLNMTGSLSIARYSLLRTGIPNQFLTIFTQVITQHIKQMSSAFSEALGWVGQSECTYVL